MGFPKREKYLIFAIISCNICKSVIFVECQFIVRHKSVIDEITICIQL